MFSNNTLNKLIPSYIWENTPYFKNNKNKENFFNSILCPLIISILSWGQKRCDYFGNITQYITQYRLLIFWDPLLPIIVTLWLGQKGMWLFWEMSLFLAWLLWVDTVYILHHFNFARTCDVLRYPCLDAPILCENGGRSVSEHGKCICKCQDGFEGKYCETVS